MDDAPWTLAELVTEVAAALRDLEPPNGQVRALPDERAVRYYTTLGLLDRPSALRGRTALYGRRHLAQVVAIKRLQAEGKALAEIQAIVPSLDDAGLARASGIEVPTRRRATAREGFWREPPAAAVATSVAGAGGARAEVVGVVGVDRAIADRMTAERPGSPVARSEGFVSQVALALAPGVVITVDAARVTSDADAEAVRAAAAPLLAELRRRRLLAP